MTLSTAPSPQSTPLQPWNHVVYAAVTVGDQMVLLSYHGPKVVSWCWKCPVGTVSLHPTFTCPQLGQACSLIMQQAIPSYCFQPIALESTGVFGQDALDIVHDVAKCLLMIIIIIMNDNDELSTHHCLYSN